MHIAFEHLCHNDALQISRLLVISTIVNYLRIAALGTGRSVSVGAGHLRAAALREMMLSLCTRSTVWLRPVCTQEGKQVTSTSFSKKPASKCINGGLHAPAVLTT
ncbi:hypothetical protein E1B25_05610 [Antarcticimicrobium sediminis]|uniref:Uncharacterized protein n=1 Tax=Antarcticimicrobium sediminis TaxID=2546227 RepID=A0A4R5EWY0_9RHOB|nr:hypothetical protein E1B25_05610 [Antarcticimicrobium sediminis]